MSQEQNTMNVSTLTAEMPVGLEPIVPCGTVAPASEETRVEVLRTFAEIEGLRSTWEKWKWHPNSDLDSYLTVVRSLPNAEPIAIVLYRGAFPETILIGRVEIGEVSLRIGYKDVARIAARKLVFIYAGLLGTPSAENCAALIQAVKSALRQGHGQVAFFNSLPTDSPLYAAALSESFWTRDRAPSLQTHRCMLLSSSSEEFYRGLSPKVRKNLGWQARRFEKEFKNSLRLHCFRRADDLAEMFQEVETIAKKTYQRGLGVGFESNRTLRDRLALEARKGWLRGFVLYAGERPVAFWLGKVYCETFHSDFMGYDPDLAKHSPGMYLITRVIEEFCNSKDESAVRNIDFGLGDAQYKQVLGTSEWQEASLHLFAPTMAGLGLNLFRTPAALFNRFAQRVLDKGSVLKLKRAWRNQAKPQARSAE
jgi:CelD/BcsL family acetyltransferase involved in cellulose biosynthesis